jgi:PP-loop superfamily ATP-utilizing enzyme
MILKDGCKKAGVMWSGGIESTIIVLACIEKYGCDNVYTFTQKFPIDDPFERAQKHYHYFVESIASEIGFTNYQFIEMGSNGLYSNEVRPEFCKKIYELHPDLDVLYSGINTVHNGPLTNAARKQEVIDAFAEFKITAPFISSTKSEAIQLYYDRGQEHILLMTRSCAKNTADHCGVCANCAERILGFKMAGKDDPTKYIRRRPQ